ncbi:MAG TPA: c-type cytochrome [Xanthobacteraceae bacterium]|nr:c-type cytochrome [Xanthobacteraceae bacterium]
MIVRGLMFAAALVASAGSALAQAPVERGKYLVNTIMTCQNCHTPKGERGAPVFERDLSSGLSWDEPPFKVTASNITQDKETGIGSWSDADIKKALQKGERPNGVRLAAIMPYDFYEILTPGDLNAIVAYLKTVKPVKQETPAPIYRIALPRHILPGAEKPFTDADMNDKVKKGFYLATIGHCFECHTPMGPRGREFETSYGKGGFEFPGPWGTSVSRNITSHKEKGIGAWTDDEIKRAITDGIRKDGSRLKPPMGFGFYKNMTAADLDAIVAYLRTVPPKE